MAAQEEDSALARAMYGCSPDDILCVYREDEAGLSALTAYFRSEENNDIAAVHQARDLLEFLKINYFEIRAIEHPQRVVTVGAWSARVDVELAPVIEALWTAGIPTSASCAGEVDREPAYISFPKRAVGRAGFATLLHAQLSSTVPDLLATGGYQHHDRDLRWDPADTPAVLRAVRALKPHAGLAWNTNRPVVTDFYGWR